ncbi:hypothetical protein V1525DRAFT_396365 [Lipomyces kononenkoae]|uniref:Uncharacterized protein n=1 Tax=Lipomyces kononenkoae TaxID=34357 RepID=A0ACC3T944_LIPKO
MRPSVQNAWPPVQAVRSLYSTRLLLLPKLQANSVRYKSSTSKSPFAIIDSVVKQITKRAKVANSEAGADSSQKKQQQQLDGLSASYWQHLQHSPVLPNSNTDESSSPVHAHYSSVISVLDDLITHYLPGLEESQRNTLRVRLPSQKWISLDVDLKACRESKDFVRLFEYFFIRGKISPSTAAEILWNPKLLSKVSILDLKKIVQNQGNLAGWSELRLETFTSEIGIKLMSIEMQAARRTNVSAKKMMEYKALIASTFEHSWIGILESGGSMSNDALRSMWYMVTRAENQFDVVASTIYRWRESIKSADANASTNDKARVSSLVNAVTQLWLMAATTANTRVVEIARNFFGGVPVVYYPPSQKFVFQFVDRLIDVHGQRYISGVASTLKNAPLLSNSSVLKKVLDIVDAMDWKLVKNGGFISLISEFAAEGHPITKQNNMSNERKSVSDALLLKRVRDLVEKNKEKSEGKPELVHSLLQHA